MRSDPSATGPSATTSSVRLVTKPTALEHFRYVGDKRNQIVYDMDAMSTDERVGKAVADITAAESYATFGPDTIDEARNRGYRPLRPQRGEPS